MTFPSMLPEDGGSGSEELEGGSSFLYVTVTETFSAGMNVIMEQKLGLFFWLYNTMKNFFSCFSNLQNYTRFRVTSPDGEVVTLFYGDICKSKHRALCQGLEFNLQNLCSADLWDYLRPHYKEAVV